MPKYPLEPLAALREKKVERATTELAGALRTREAAARTLRTAEARRDAQEQAAARVRAAELEALAKGELRARDLARVDAWGVRAGAERAALVTIVDRAATAEGTAREAEAQAQASLVVRHADARVVEVHRERWNEERRKDLEARDEQASEEAWRPKR
jgi:hypothetical protein